MATPAKAEARLDPTKNFVLSIVLVTMAAGGIALVVIGSQRDWGFVGLFWSGVMVVFALAGLIGRARGGGFASAPCPHCGASIRFMNIEAARTERCDQCGEWSAGTSEMRALAADHVARMAVFPVPLSKGEVRWPTGPDGAQRCPVCAGVCTRSVQLEASSVLSNAFAMLSPISLQRVHSLRAPACDHHDDGVALDLDESQEALELTFRSFAYMQDFVRLNAEDAGPPDYATLKSYLVDHERHVELRAPLICPRHGCDVHTTLGFESRMDYLPSQEWCKDSEDNPVCLRIGHSLSPDRSGSYDRVQIAWCPECEAGMARAHAARYGD